MGKLQGDEWVLVAQLKKKLSSLESAQTYDKHVAEKSIEDIKMLLIQHIKI